MEKLIVAIMILTTTIFANNSLAKKNCLSCHQKEQIPSHLIYKRYLLKYSTKNRMKKVMLKYAKNPTKKGSIMPTPFFFKFPMKRKLNLDSETLKKSIDDYLDYFDVKKRLVLESKEDSH